MNQNIYIK